MALRFFACMFLVSLAQLLNFSSGYSPVKSAYWFPDSGLAATDIDSTLFTHLFCAFADLDPQTNELTVCNSKSVPFSQFTQTVQFKNPNVKTLLSIGGGTSKPADFASMASNPTSRRSFINSSFKIARAYNFLGLDFDWEHPQTATEMANFGKLLDEWRAALEEEARHSRKPQLILTASVSVAPTVGGFNYPVHSITRSLDWINVMAYDFYGPSWSPKATNANAALYDSIGKVSGSYGIEAWIQAGVPAKKLVLGLPFYGHSWQLVNVANHGLEAPANGASGSGDMTYNEIVTFIKMNNATAVYNKTIVANYCYAGTTWIGYDDRQSISTKVVYAKRKGLLGYSAWHLAADNTWLLSKQAKQAWGA